MSYHNLKSLDVVVTKDKKTDKVPDVQIVNEVKLDKEMNKPASFGNKKTNYSSNKSIRKRPPSQSPAKNAKKKNVDFDVPDRSFGDLYCRPCDAHMNSDLMWQAHIQGKRHLKHAKKGEQADSKYQYLDEAPAMQAEIDAVEEPIAGLQHFCEIQRNEQRPTYNCFLCSSNIAVPKQVIEHMLGFKHRMAYLKEHDPSQFDLLNASQMRKGHLESVVEDLIRQHESTNGRGEMCVKKEKPAAETESDRWQDSHSSDRDRRSNNASRDGRDSWSKESDRFLRETDRSRRNNDRPRERSPERKRERSRDREFERRTAGKSDSPPYHRRSVYEESSSQHYPRESLGYDPLVDLREKLDQRKAQERYEESLRTVTVSKPPPVPEVAAVDPIDAALPVINCLDSVSFLQLVLFKLGNISIDNETERKLLEKVMDKTTSMCYKAKQQQIPPMLRAKFQESMALNGIQVPESNVPDNSLDINKFIEYFKKASGSQNSVPESPPSRYSASVQYPQSVYEPVNRSGSQAQPMPRKDEQLWERLPTTTPFLMSSDATPIPGLTLAEQSPPPPPPRPTPLAVMMQSTQKLFGAYSLTNRLEENTYRR